jgi:hypothetical protein
MSIHLHLIGLWMIGGSGLDILSPTVRRRCNCVSACMTLALILFYVSALFIYYSSAIPLPDPSPHYESGTNSSPERISVRAGSDEDCSVIFLCCPDLQAGLAESSVLYVQLQAMIPAPESLPEMVPARLPPKGSRAPPLRHEPMDV